MLNSTSKSALLVMDMQNSVVSRLVENDMTLLPFQKAFEAARGHGILVIYVRSRSAPDRQGYDSSIYFMA